ncbi:MAG: DODA-type extradiol aromatic ring-opening family dioxygenase [Acidimicrobiales bacterium]
MGEIVFAGCLSHAPGITGFTDRAEPRQLERLQAGWRSLREALQRSRPDAVVGVSSEHFTNFFLSNLPAFTVGTAVGYASPADEDLEEFLGLSRHIRAGHADLGGSLLQGLMDKGFDPALVAGGLGFDENFAVPLALLDPDNSIPIVPITVNALQPPFPSLQRCWSFGEALGELIRGQEVVERVAVLATGGLSHWVGVARSGEIDEEFDARFLSRIAAGEAQTLAAMEQTELNAAGNGANEIRAWLMVAAAVDAAPFRTLAYEPVPEWSTGIAVTQADLGGAGR